MICVYDRGNDHVEKMGDAVLQPTECRIKMVAAGEYSLSMVHPIDEGRKWEHLVPEALIKAPVPEETIETSYTGMEVDLYRTTGAAALRTGTNEPTTINYSAWSASATYAPGSRVTSAGRNWQCTTWDATSDIRLFPPQNSSWWVEIARTTPGDPVIANLGSGTDLYYVENAGGGWLKMSTTYGMEGYLKASQVEFVRHISAEENQPRHIREQVFRIRSSTADTKAGTVTVNAEHVSYDLSGVLVRDAKIHKKTPATALYMIEQEYMLLYRGTVATNLTAATDGTYTGEIKGKNAMYALLDPDKGIVATFGAMLRRDNWDLFVMRKTEMDRGFRLRYGKNIRGVNWAQKSDNLITMIVPVAKDENGEDYYLPEGRIDSPYMSLYPVQRMERLKVSGQIGKDDGTETGTVWTEAALQDEMRAKARARFNVDKADRILHEITIDFTMQGDTAEYAWMKPLEHVILYDQVLAIDERIGLSVSVEVVELEWDAIRETVTGLKLSNVNWYGGRSVTGFNVMNNSLTGDKLTDDAGDGFIASAVDEATEAAQEYTNNRVANLNSTLRKWVENNYERKTTENEE